MRFCNGWTDSVVAEIHKKIPGQIKCRIKFKRHAIDSKGTISGNGGCTNCEGNIVLKGKVCGEMSSIELLLEDLKCSEFISRQFVKGVRRDGDF